MLGTLVNAPSVPLMTAAHADAPRPCVVAPQRSVLLEIFDTDQGTLVLGRLNMYELVRLHECVSKWLKGTGWVPAYAAALSPAQKKLLCDGTPFLDMMQLEDALGKGPLWLVETFVKELKAKQVDFNKPEEKVLRVQHEALATRRRNIRNIKSALARYHRELDTLDDRLQLELKEVQHEFEREREHAEGQIASLTTELHRLEGAMP